MTMMLQSGVRRYEYLLVLVLINNW